MAALLLRFEAFHFEGQRSTAALGYQNDQAFPLALEVDPKWKPTVDEAADHIRDLTLSGSLLEALQQHGGALLIRGLPIQSADDYSLIAHAFGFEAHEEVGRPPVRTVLAKNVKTANEGPPELPIWPHNEYGWSTQNPAWLTFSCLEVPESGGETPLISSIGLASKLEREAPKFYQGLLAKGVRYVYRYGREQVTSTTGASVLAAYGQHVEPQDDEPTIRSKIESEVKRHSKNFEWHEDGSLSVTHVVPIIRKHVATGSTTWFGNLTSAYGRSRHHSATEPPFRGYDGSCHPLPTYGDGSHIELLYNLSKLYRSPSIYIQFC